MFSKFHVVDDDAAAQWFPMQVATTAPQISRGLLAGDPDMAKV
jgi:hypothetical protein